MVDDLETNKHKAVGEWSSSGDFLGSILAGLVLGLVADHFLGTDPWLVVAGIVGGSTTGFWRMHQHAKRAEAEAMRERAKRHGHHR